MNFRRESRHSSPGTDPAAVMKSAHDELMWAEAARRPALLDQKHPDIIQQLLHHMLLNTDAVSYSKTRASSSLCSLSPSRCPPDT